MFQFENYYFDNYFVFWYLGYVDVNVGFAVIFRFFLSFFLEESLRYQL